MATKKKAAKANKSKRVLAVPLKEAADTWPKATEARARRSDNRLEVAFIRASTEERKRQKTLLAIEALNIPAKLRPLVERVRQYMGGSIHDPFAVASSEAFFLGVELQGRFPEFRGQIKGRQNATRKNKIRADEWKEYAQNQFKEIRAHNAEMPRHRVVKEAIKQTRFHFGIRPRLVKGKPCKWPGKRIQSDIFKGMK